ncbi:Ppx/GppA phosphatase family protein [Massilia sp. TS11]|uniref:Ppx/GppA phosphatase family protein n=1 Tax=Massilia sp. TS11 TaxID=2908003 RepID=UPI001EDAB064|nr:Ppx/GppA phosphatase family protein [Massilia sp. TS11]MCG2585204.1 Ppx/GppA family phosphatase [Massilia sp. TS11]
MFAAVDLGSNSFRLHIGQPEGNGMRIVRTAREPVRLAAGLTRELLLTEQAMSTALACLANFRSLLAEYPLSAVRVVATSALRSARNAGAFLPLAEQAIGQPIEIISGEEEGRLIYMGVATTFEHDNERCLVVDIGGGSTEVVLGHGSRIHQVESFSIGTQPQASRFFADGRITADAFDGAVLAARSFFEDAAPLYRPQHWDRAYGTSGTMRAMANTIAKSGIGDGTLSYKNLLALKTRLIACGHVERVNLPGLKPERVVALVGGLAVLLGVMEELQVPGLEAINAGLRMGVLHDLQLRATRHDRREESVQEFMRRFGVDGARARRVARMAGLLYGQLADADSQYGNYLHWSALLHEIGQTISHTQFHKHGAYIVEHADLPGFTRTEQKLIASMVLGHKGNLRKLGEDLGDAELVRALLALRLATLFMHGSADADIGTASLRIKKQIELELDAEWRQRHPTLSYMLEKEREWWREVGLSMQLKFK